MLDVRYHIFYLGLMFLMLGLGIIIGASIIGPAQVHQQAGAIANLRVAANKVAQDRDLTRDRMTKDESALSSMRPLLVHGKLAGRRVILVQTGDYPEATQEANTAVSDAGAIVAATVVLTNKWGALLPKQRLALSSVADPTDTPSQDKALLTALALVLTTGSGVTSPTLEGLKEQGLITVSGELSQPCTLFVLVGGQNDDSPNASRDALLLDGFKAAAANLTLVGCESSKAVASSVQAYQNAGIATVDCIDLPLGQIALPSALRGEAGDYGVKLTAKQPLPDSLTEASSPGMSQ